MATRTISTRLAIEGQSEFEQSIAGINRSLKTMQSELAKVESEYRNNANSIDALTAKGKVLEDIKSKENEKIKETKLALEGAQAAQKSHADSYADYGAKIAEAQKKLERLQSSTDDTTKEQADLNAELKKYQTAQDTAGASQKAATRGVEDWQRKLNYAERDLNDLNGEILQNEKYLDEARTSTDKCATSIDQYGKEVKQAGQESDDFGGKSKDAINTLAGALAAAGVVAGLKEIASAIKACTDASIEFESAITGVYKTVDGTDAQLAQISDGIKQMAMEMPASTTEIAAVAEAAGQLGIATDDVLSFSKVMLNLGESTNLSADEAATALAKFANITGTTADDYERLGSVIVGLGNNFATTEADIVEMSTRLAGAGTLAGLSETEIMALAAAMSSVGIEAEAGGTAMTQTLTAIEKAAAIGGDDLEEFARIAGMSASEFKTAWETDAITAIQSFIGGLGKLDEQGESATLVLDEMGLSGVRQSNMLKSLALASDTLSGAVGLSNQAWTENTALVEEANKRYATTESKLAMAENAMQNMKAAIGDALAPALAEMAELGTDAFTWAAEFVEDHPEIVAALTGVVVAVGALTVGIAGLTVASAALAAVKAALAALNPATLPIMAITAAVVGLSTAFGALSAASNEESNANRELVKSIEQNRQARQESAEQLEAQQKDNTGHNQVCYIGMPQLVWCYFKIYGVSVTMPGAFFSEHLFNGQLLAIDHTKVRTRRSALNDTPHVFKLYLRFCAAGCVGYHI